MMREFIVYQGPEFAIEWYYDVNGKSQPLDYFNALIDSQKRKFLHLVKLMGDFGQIRNKEKFNYEGDQLYAFKPRPDRFLCFFFKDEKIIITNAFEKKSRNYPARRKIELSSINKVLKKGWPKENIMNKKTPSTYDRFLANSKQKKLFEKEYHELLLSELIIALMEEDHLSVRKLASAAGLSPTIIQELRSGKKKNITLQTFLKLIKACGRVLFVENLVSHERVIVK